MNRRAVEFVISDKMRFAAADYEIDSSAFTIIDRDGGSELPNGESVSHLDIVSVTEVAEDPLSPIGVYARELDANASSAVSLNDFALENYDVTVTPGTFEVKGLPELSAIFQDVYFEQWMRDDMGYDPEDVFSKALAISQSLGLRLIGLPSWSNLSNSERREVLSRLDEIPLHLQSVELAEKIIDQIQ